MYGRRDAEGSPGHDCAHRAVGRAGAWLRGDRGNQAQERPGIRSAGRDNLSGPASVGAGGAALQPLGSGRIRKTAPRLQTDAARAARSDRTRGSLAAFLASDRGTPGRFARGREASVTGEFLDSLAAALSFDRALARRVRKEFEDHLQQAVAGDRSEDRQAAERRAVARLGDPRTIAAELAVTALAQRAKRLAGGLVLALLGVLLSMKGHGAWYAAMQWRIPDDMQP